MQFPSSEWFEALITEVNNDEVKFRRLGWCDADIRVDVREGASTSSFVIAFREYGCAGVSEVESGASPAVDFALAADSEQYFRRNQVLVTLLSEHRAGGDDPERDDQSKEKGVHLYDLRN